MPQWVALWALGPRKSIWPPSATPLFPRDISIFSISSSTERLAVLFLSHPQYPFVDSLTYSKACTRGSLSPTLPSLRGMESHRYIPKLQKLLSRQHSKLMLGCQRYIKTESFTPFRALAYLIGSGKMEQMRPCEKT